MCRSSWQDEHGNALGWWDVKGKYLFRLAVMLGAIVAALLYVAAELVR